MARTIVDELVTILDFKTSSGSAGQINKFKSSMGGLKKVALLAGAALSAAAAAFSIRKVNQTAAATVRFADSINETTDILQAFRFAGEQVGVTFDEIDSGLKQIVTTASSIKPGSFNPILMLLGVSPTDTNRKLKTGAALLIDISAALQKLSRIQQIQALKDLGLEQLSKLLIKGPAEIKAYLIEAKKIGAVIPEKTLNNSIAFQKNMSKIGATFRSLSQAIVLSVTPALTRLIEKFEKFLLANHELIAGSLLGILKGIGLAFRILGVILTPVIAIFKKIANVLQDSAGAAKIFGIIIGSLIGLKLISMISKIALLTTEFLGLNKMVKTTTGSLKALALTRGLLIPVVGVLVAIGFGLNALLNNEAVKKIVSRKDVQQALDVTVGGPSGSAFGLSNSYQPSDAQLKRMNTTNNVTVNVNGAKEPAVVAREVRKQIDLSTAAQGLEPGTQRIVVT